MNIEEQERRINGDAVAALHSKALSAAGRKRTQVDALRLMRWPVKHGHSGFAHQPKAEHRMPDLHGREIVALALRAHGYGGKAISKRLGIHALIYLNFLSRNGIERRVTNPTQSPAHKASLWGDYVVQEVDSQAKQEHVYEKALRPWGRSSKQEIYRANIVDARARGREAAARQYATRRQEPVYVLRRRIRSRTNNAIRRAGSKKAGRTIAYIGCSWNFYMAYISSLFRPGMDWNNHGQWHIDHIIPLATFDLTNEEERRKAFNWSNTRPLWAALNSTRPKDGSDLVWVNGQCNVHDGE